MLYQIYEYQRAAFSPFYSLAETLAKNFTNSASPWSYLPNAHSIAAAYELIYRIGKEYEKPAFNIHQIQIDDVTVAVVEQTILKKHFCKLIGFKRYSDDLKTAAKLRAQPTILICAPLAGHYATLLRDTVKSFLSTHNVFITDWENARNVPIELGSFTLTNYIEYILEFIDFLGSDCIHVISVCQPTVPVLAAISLMAARGIKTPLSLVLMGGPVDARKSPTAVNSLALQHPIEWFENNLIQTVPSHFAGTSRKVYPGFLQHAGFVAMNPDKHLNSHWAFYQNLLKGSNEDAASHRKFYDEYNAVIDLTAEYYLETIRCVFQKFSLANGNWWIGNELVNPKAIQKTALLTIEGELDDISGSGQTHSAQDLCTGINDNKKAALTFAAVGHYGLFSGRKWRNIIYPKVVEFCKTHDRT